MINLLLLFYRIICLLRLAVLVAYSVIMNKNKSFACSTYKVSKKVFRYKSKCYKETKYEFIYCLI